MSFVSLFLGSTEIYCPSLYEFWNFLLHLLREEDCTKKVEAQM